MRVISALSRLCAVVRGRGRNPGAAPPAPLIDSGVISGLGARNIGSAAMSGRIAALAGFADPSGKVTLFVGAASAAACGSRTDGGTTFKPVFDKQPVQSIGAIAIDPTQPQQRLGRHRRDLDAQHRLDRRRHLQVDRRRRDLDATWACPSSERISRIIVDPRDSATRCYACVPGKLWSDSAERGLYKTTRRRQDLAAGAEGRQPLDRLRRASRCDPRNPDVLFAGLWDFRRKGWTFRSGGDGPKAPVRQRPVPQQRRRQDLDAR